MLAVFKREFKAYFISPIGYVVLAVFLFFSGYYFSYMYSAGYPDVTFIFSQLFSIALFIVPIITMRLISEDKRQKVDQALLTAPVKLSAIVAGKFFAALSVFMLGFSITLIFQVILSFYVQLNWLVFIGNMVGIILLGSSIIAIGLFISSLTESQVVSAVATFAAVLLINLMDTFSQTFNNPVVTKITEWISFSGRYNSFVTGIFDYANAIFFLSITAVFLFLTVRMLEKKRWS